MDNGSNKILRHCCHNCYHFREGLTFFMEEFYECRKKHKPDEAEASFYPTDCEDFAINTDNDNLIFDEEEEENG